MGSQVNVGIVGYGYWGPNLLRNFWELDDCSVVACCDLSQERLSQVQKRYPGVRCTQNVDELLCSPKIDAVVVATPLSTHYAVARKAIEQGKHVLVEKPLAGTSEQALDLVERAARAGKVLMVDHTFVYTSAVRKIRELIDAGEVGELLYYDSVRINLGLVQSDTNVLWDLGPHDFSIMDYLCGLDPKSVSATAVTHLNCPFENIAYITVRFDSSLIAHFHLNWLAPVKVRMTLVGGSKKMLVYNDMESSDKVKVYDRGIIVNHDPERRVRLLTGYRNGDMLAPQLDTTEALRVMASEFVNSILENRPPLTNGAAGYRVVRLLEAAQKSIEQNGHEIEVGDPPLPRSSGAEIAAAK